MSRIKLKARRPKRKVNGKGVSEKQAKGGYDSRSNPDKHSGSSMSEVQRAQVIAMAAQGVPPKKMAAAMGITASAITQATQREWFKKGMQEIADAILHKAKLDLTRVTGRAVEVVDKVLKRRLRIRDVKVQDQIRLASQMIELSKIHSIPTSSAANEDPDETFL